MEHAPFGYVERQIRQAAERGEFDRLPGKGKPIPDLGETYDPAWWAKKYLRRQRALDRLAEVAAEAERRLDMIWMVTEEAEVRRMVAELNRRLDEANRDVPESDRRPLLAEDRVVSAWRKNRRVR